MRQDQYERLQQLEEGLTDIFIAEADPKRWPGADVEAAAMTKEDRGDRYWCKKNAFATLSLVQRISTLIGQVQGPGTTPAAQDGAADLDSPDIEAETASAEREAKRLLEALTSKGGRASS